MNQRAALELVFLSIGVVLLAGATAPIAWAVGAAEGAGGARAIKSPLPGVASLPAIAELPNPFVMADGSAVKTPRDWSKRRAELVRLVLGYEYGRLPVDATGVEVAGEVKADAKPATTDPGTGAVETEMVLHMGPGGQLAVPAVVTAQAGKGPFPVIIKGDLCWGRVDPAIVANVVKHGYLLIEFDRTAIAPDKKDAPGGVRPLYPDADWGTIAAWAWGYHRVTDYAARRPDVDARRIVITGHSRGGKATLLAGALDERVALTVPNGSGCGGAGCFRVTPVDAESIGAITHTFPYWFAASFPQFVGHVEQLPFDQHEVRALCAPRALLDTEGSGDLWANPHGTQQSFLAAREVYKFLGVPDAIGIHYRPGKHDQTDQDWAALLDFADHLFFGKPLKEPFDRLPFPGDKRAFSWSAP